MLHFRWLASVRSSVISSLPALVGALLFSLCPFRSFRSKLSQETFRDHVRGQRARINRQVRTSAFSDYNLFDYTKLEYSETTSWNACNICRLQYSREETLRSRRNEQKTKERTSPRARRCVIIAELFARARADKRTRRIASCIVFRKLIYVFQLGSR